MSDTVKVEVPINTAGIDSALAKVLVESAIGKEIEKAVAKSLGTRGNSWGKTVLEQAVETCVNDEVRKMIRDELMKPEISEVIRAKIAAKLSDDLVIKFVEQSIERMRFRD